MRRCREARPRVSTYQAAHLTSRGLEIRPSGGALWRQSRSRRASGQWNSNSFPSGTTGICILRSMPMMGTIRRCFFRRRDGGVRRIASLSRLAVGAARHGAGAALVGRPRGRHPRGARTPLGFRASRSAIGGEVPRAAGRLGARGRRVAGPGRASRARPDGPAAKFDRGAAGPRGRRPGDGQSAPGPLDARCPPVRRSLWRSDQYLHRTRRTVGAGVGDRTCASAARHESRGPRGLDHCGGLEAHRLPLVAVQMPQPDHCSGSVLRAGRGDWPRGATLMRALVALPLLRPASLPAQTFTVGRRVHADASVCARPDTLVVGTGCGTGGVLRVVGDHGTLVRGPAGSSTPFGVSWFVDYDVGQDGWSTAKYLALDSIITPPPPPPPPPPPSVV